MPRIRIGRRARLPRAASLRRDCRHTAALTTVTVRGVNAAGTTFDSTTYHFS